MEVQMFALVRLPDNPRPEGNGGENRNGQRNAIMVLMLLGLLLAGLGALLLFDDDSDWKESGMALLLTGGVLVGSLAGVLLRPLLARCCRPSPLNFRLSAAALLADVVAMAVIYTLGPPWPGWVWLVLPTPIGWFYYNLGPELGRREIQRRA